LIKFSTFFYWFLYYWRTKVKAYCHQSVFEFCDK